MTTAIAERPTDTPAPVVTNDQLDLIKRTVAKDATVDELKLYLYDCQRQGVHPLDKLIHFTKRSGKYTPVTSIDFMRTRAADTGDYAGSDDAVFEETIHGVINHATVTVWRLVQGQRCPFTATARWSEYKPESNDFMWKKMPHTMLAKCAEALALRKGFPRQLAGLYAREEMDQADRGGYVVEPNTKAEPAIPTQDSGRREGGGASVVAQGTVGLPAHSDGLLRIERLDVMPTANKNIRKVAIVLSDGRQVTTIKEQLAALAEELCQRRTPVTVDTKTTKWGEDLVALHRVLPTIDVNDDLLDREQPPTDIAF